ncbi:MAG: exodeoxyribonuclease VII small subunit [Saprospiraceae bacterium]|nr:exodeoxyribonuclease VII small subunit [Saprospiraceae bacterium]
MENMTYEAALLELQQIVTALESGEIGIDELSTKTERAAALIRFCQEKLRKTEEQVNNLFEND